MPNQIIDIPGVGPVEFPDTMSDEQVSNASKRLWEDHNPEDAKRMGAAETARAETLRPTGLSALTPGNVMEAGGQLAHMAGQVPGVLSGLWDRTKELGSAVGANVHQSMENMRTNTMPETHNQLPGMVDYAVHEPARIGRQLGEGTPEALGKSLLDTAMYIPAVLGAKRMIPESVTPQSTVATVKAVANHPLTAKAANVAVAAGEGYLHGGPMGAVLGGVTGGSILNKLMKLFGKEGPAAETPLLSPEADALRASVDVQGPATPMQNGRGVAPPVQESAESQMLGAGSLEHRAALDAQAQLPQQSAVEIGGGGSSRPPMSAVTPTPPEAPVNPNAGGRMVPGTPEPTVNDALIKAMQEAAQPESVTLAPSHPQGGGFTTPTTDVNAGGRLAAGSAKPTVQDALLNALKEAQGAPTMKTTAAPELPLRGGGTGRGELTVDSLARQAAQGREPHPSHADTMWGEQYMPDTTIEHIPHEDITQSKMDMAGVDEIIKNMSMKGETTTLKHTGAGDAKVAKNAESNYGADRLDEIERVSGGSGAAWAKSQMGPSHVDTPGNVAMPNGSTVSPTVAKLLKKVGGMTDSPRVPQRELSRTGSIIDRIMAKRNAENMTPLSWEDELRRRMRKR